MLQRMTIETVWIFQYQRIIKNDSIIIMVSWWGNDLYFNNEKIKIGDIEMITSAYVSSR